MFTYIDQLLADIEINNDELRNALYEIMNSDINPLINVILECQLNLSKCALCISTNQLHNYLQANAKILNLLRLISNSRSF